jgi:hypothetical protein
MAGSDSGHGSSTGHGDSMGHGVGLDPLLAVDLAKPTPAVGPYPRLAWV